MISFLLIQSKFKNKIYSNAQTINKIKGVRILNKIRDLFSTYYHPHPSSDRQKYTRRNKQVKILKYCHQNYSDTTNTFVGSKIKFSQKCDAQHGFQQVCTYVTTLGRYIVIYNCHGKFSVRVGAHSLTVTILSTAYVRKKITKML